MDSYANNHDIEPVLTTVITIKTVLVPHKEHIASGVYSVAYQ